MAISHDFVVVGAGPAGLQWALLMREAGIDDYVILEAEPRAAAFFDTYPRSRRLISANRAHALPGRSDEFRLRHDWHSLLGAPSFAAHGFSSQWNPSASELTTYLRALASSLKIEYNTSVVRTEFDLASGLHHVHTAGGAVWRGSHLIIATGMRMTEPPSCLSAHAASAGLPLYTYANFPNASGGADFCRGRAVTVLGGGNAAFEASDLLAPCAASVRLAYRHRPRFSHLTHYVGDVRLTNLAIYDRYLLKSLDDLMALPKAEWLQTEESYVGGEGRWGSAYEAARARANAAKARKGSRSRARADDEGLEESGGLGGGGAPVMGGLDDEALECMLYRTMAEDPHAVFVYAGGFTGARAGLVGRLGKSRRFPQVGPYWSDPSVARKFYAGNLMHDADYRHSAGE